MNLVFLILGFIIGFLLGINIGKYRCRKRVAEILDETIKEKNEYDNPCLLTGEELKRTEEARMRGEK